MPREFLARIEKIEKNREEKFRLYGDVRDIIHADFQGYKFVAVNHELHYSQKWKTFPDFLFQFIKTALTRVFGKDWAPTEMQRPVAERHPILRWYDALCRIQAATAASSKPSDGIFHSTLDGPSTAYIALAYDLYTLAHSNLLQAEVVRRLKGRDTFRTARYELFVMATMLRAGFDVVAEDESDGSRRHPEFVATHKKLGDRLAVEAKSKWRRGVVEWKLNGPIPEDFSLNIRDLLDDAIAKRPADPLLIFIDANMPPEFAAKEQQRWLGEINALLARTAYKGFSEGGVFEGVPFTALLLTNIPHDYAAPGQPDPPKIGFLSEPLNPNKRLKHPQILMDIERGVKQYGTVPQDFPPL